MEPITAWKGLTYSVILMNSATALTGDIVGSHYLTIYWRAACGHLIRPWLSLVYNHLNFFYFLSERKKGTAICRPKFTDIKISIGRFKMLQPGTDLFFRNFQAYMVIRCLLLVIRNKCLLFLLDPFLRKYRNIYKIISICTII